ncbi:MAG TPA: glycoside hydrolase family 15 protein, partial [Candidatus Nanoarchaeia archaeon]|nr:glycoside hydrolase family 15 protein [Candidatus Nanoarchaeia archaeon]
AWIRDNVYIALCLEQIDEHLAVPTYHALLGVLKRHEWKLDEALRRKPTQSYFFVHPRYDPVDQTEVEGEWGNKQHDAVGLFLFAIGRAVSKGMSIIRSEDDARILQKLIFYLDAVEYWKEPDNGIWENEEVLHASSIGACVAGLQAMQKHLFVPQVLIERGEQALRKLLPQESALRETDLALLSLIWPLNVVDSETAENILKRVEDQLVRNKGVIRHVGDWYYAHPETQREAEWPLGFAWLAMIYKQKGNAQKYRFYLRKLMDTLTEEGNVPELFYGSTNIPNQNTPLAWGQAIMLALSGDRENDRT